MFFCSLQLNAQCSETKSSHSTTAASIQNFLTLAPRFWFRTAAKN